MQFIQRALEILSYPFQLLFAAPIALVNLSRGVRGLSLAAQAALTVAVLMVLMTVAATGLYVWRQDRPDLLNALSSYTLRLAIVTLITPPFVYLAVWLWGEGRESRFPDINAAWQAGTAALAREGLSLTESPVFLVLGLRDKQQVRAFMKASGLKFAIYDTPEVASPLYFYAVHDYHLTVKDERWSPIFVVLTDASQTSKLVALSASLGRDRVHQPVDDTVRVDAQRGADFAAEVGATMQPAADALRGTIVGSGGFTPPTPRPGPPGNLGATLVGGGGAPAAPARAVLDKQEATLQSARLAHVCRLLEQTREPFCALNGVLVVTPFALFRRGIEQVRDLAQATRQDLRTIQRTAQMRCPAISLIGGMEHEAGFGELVRRVGAAPALEQRVGSKFEPWNPATRERLELLAELACDNVELNVYELFRKPDGYNKPGNSKLYGLLCRTRTGFQEVLKEFLSKAFAQQSQDESPMLFAGCYFAATGEVEALRGFLKGVLADRLLERQDDLQWTDAALRQDASYENWAKAGMLVSGLLVLGALGMYFYSRK
jgi:IcmF-related N-terminal domain